MIGVIRAGAVVVTWVGKWIAALYVHSFAQDTSDNSHTLTISLLIAVL